jgi:hypothetical protein
MDWATFAASTSTAAVLSGVISLGFARFNSRLDRRIDAKQAEASHEADLVLPHRSGVFWLLHNRGNADALDVHLDLMNNRPMGNQVYDWPRIAHGESEEVQISLARGQTTKVEISWTSERYGTRKTATRVP